MHAKDFSLAKKVFKMFACFIKSNPKFINKENYIDVWKVHWEGLVGTVNQNVSSSQKEDLSNKIESLKQGFKETISCYVLQSIRSSIFLCQINKSKVGNSLYSSLFIFIEEIVHHSQIENLQNMFQILHWHSFNLF